MPVKVIRYKCSYCNKRVRAKKSDIEKHERICFYNPDVHSCVTCDFKDDVESENGGLKQVCRIYQKDIFIKGKPIRDCYKWRQTILFNLNHEDI